MKKNQISIRSSVAEYLIEVVFAGNQQDSVEMHYEEDNIWLTQKMMATLYDVDVRTINEHIMITIISSIGTSSTAASTTRLSIVGMAVPCCHL